MKSMNHKIGRHSRYDTDFEDAFSSVFVQYLFVKFGKINNLLFSGFVYSKLAQATRSLFLEEF